MLNDWMLDLFHALDDATGISPFVAKGVVAVLLVCTVCGMVGSLVVGNRMAFFSDAMAHCAFAGVALGALSVVASGVGKDIPDPIARRAATEALAGWLVPLVMVLFGAAVGVAMVYMRERTGLANDTIIGVFFALAIGFGAMLSRVLNEVSTFDAENFLFGNLVLLPETELLYLLGLVVVVAALLGWRYNQLVFASFNPSLARTRRVPLRLNNYLFIVLLALVVNLSIKAVGALLINALLVVPAAAASNVSRNLRQMFWLTIGFCLLSGLLGYYLSNAVPVPVGPGQWVKFGPSGTIVVVSVALFFASAAWGFRGRRPSPVARR